MQKRIGSIAAVLLTSLTPPSSAQLTDLQPGRNFPTAQAAFGTGRSESIDHGDVDNDGDRDVVVGNGGDGSAQQNLIYVNLGGLQGGAAGSFADQTATRFAGVTVDTTRDMELVDIDGDCDLDVYVANRGTTVNGGEVARSYLNLGGRQHGTTGYFSEATDAFWGTLVSVPVGDQLYGSGVGPFRDFACDCDFGDLDLDGDLDLFHSSYGPNINGTRDSRVFLNDGDGRFDELWPWADPLADIQNFTFDLDLVDLDGDWDLDVFNASRNSQARVYRNDLDADTRSWPGSPFTDVTQSALLDTGSGLQGSSNYDSEYTDVDGDGDFDIWAMNYANFNDRVLENQGHMTFVSRPGWIKGDPAQDEHEIDFLDYDSDGDMDLFAANFSGTNWIYQNGLADGLDPDLDGLFHRTGTTTGGSLASWPELPASGNTGTTLDGECADFDGDGDPDILLANDANQQNRYDQNVLGVPDTHAPTVQQLTQQADKADGSDTVIRAALRDNSAYYVVNDYRVDLYYALDGGPENRVRMTAQGSQQFQAVIPGALSGTIAYRVAGADEAGNVFTTSTWSYLQNASGNPAWQHIDVGSLGVHGRPSLDIGGSALPGEPVTLRLCDAAPSALAVLLLSGSSAPLPFKGGTLHTLPLAGSLALLTDPGGVLWIEGPWPALPVGLQSWWQVGVADALGTGGAALSNAIHAIQP